MNGSGPLVRVVQITDPHLRSARSATLRRVVVYDHLQRTVGEIVRFQPDVVICTGDIADDLSRPAYAHFRGIVEGVAPIVGVVPGNHDDRQKMLREMPDWCEALPCGAVVFRYSVADWLIVALDSQLPGQVAGYLGPQQVAWFKELVAGSSARRVLVFLHHPPGPVGSPWMDAVILQNYAELGQLWSQCRVAALFCGHTHFEHRDLVDGVPYHCTPATSFQFDRFAPLVRNRMSAFRTIDLYPDHWTSQLWWVGEHGLVTLV